MKVFILLSVFCAVALAAEKDVVDLSDDDIDSRLSEFETTLVMFYAPWCGHCKRLKPEYAKAAEIVKDDDPPIVLAKIDCTEAGKESCSKYGVSGYPTLKIFKKGELSSDYNGPREANGIVKYMRAQVGPASKEIKSVEDFDKFIGKETSIFGFFEKDSTLKKSFLKFADKNREKFRFGHSSNAEVLKKQGEKDAVFIFRAKQYNNKFEDSAVKYDGSDDLNAFVSANIHGLVGVRTRDNLANFGNPSIVAYYAVDYVKNVKGTNYWRNRILKVATEFKDKLTFAISSKDEFQHELNEFGLDFVGDKPVVLARDSKNLKYKLTEEFSVESLKNFATQLLNDELEPFIKSEPVPEDNDGPVKVAVAKNFDELVMKSNRDALVEFYAPWCGHCKKLAPIYDELGKELYAEEVDIVKMDATANDVPPEFKVQGFPTLFWVPKNNKNKPIQYEGGRELDDFIKYIAKHSTDGLQTYDRKGKKVKNEL